MLFVAIYSVQPHKEARFIFYVVPALTAASALGANYVFAHRTKTLLYGLVSLALPLSIAAAFAGSAAMLLLSTLNYPGGDAVTQLFRLTQQPASSSTSQIVSVHADVLTCMTGLTLFGQNPHGLPLAHGIPSAPAEGSTAPLLMFDKTEDEDVLSCAEFWTLFDYILTEDPSKTTGGQWKTIGIVQGYDGVEVLRSGARAANEDDVDDRADPEMASLTPPILGRGAVVRRVRTFVRSLTGGWYVGPRMAPRIHILKQVTLQPKQIREVNTV